MNCIALRFDGHVLASASCDHSVALWDTVTYNLISPLKGHRDMVYSVAFSQDGSRVASGGQDNQCIVWDARSFEILVRIDHPDLVSSI